MKPTRERSGYLWATQEERERIDRLIKASDITGANNHLNTKADFIRIAVIVMGELLKRKKIKPPLNCKDQEGLINYLISRLGD